MVTRLFIWLTYDPGMANGGTIAHTYILGSRDSILDNIPAATAAYTATSNHIRATTTTAVAGK